MNKSKFLLIGLFIGLLFSLAGVYAQEIRIINGEEYVVTPNVGFNLIDWFKFNFGIQQFSVVGNAQQCSGSEYQFEPGVTYLTYLQGEQASLNAGLWCPGGQGLWNIFLTWTPWLETKNAFGLVCNSPICRVQLYCCPRPEPSSTPQCQDWYGPSSVRNHIVCPVWSNPPLQGSYPWSVYRCTGIGGQQEQNIPARFNVYDYCGQGEPRTCYYYSGSGSSCSSLQYYGYSTCEGSSGPGGGSYQGHTLYNSLSTCNANIPQNPPTCTSFTYSSWGACVNGWQTRTITSSQPNGCTGGNPQSLGRTCDGGGGLCGNGVVNSGEQCDGSNLNGATCQTRGFDSGTLSCTSSCTFNTNQCSSDEEPPEVNDPPVVAVIQDVRLADADGNYITSDTVLQPGQLVTAKFKVRTKYSDFALRFCDNPLSECIGSPWLGGLTYDSNKEYNIEAGIIPAKTSIDWFGEDITVGTFSLFAVSKSESQCCENQPNVLADKTSYTATLTGKTWQYLLGQTDKYVTSEHELTIQVPDKDTTDLCPVEGKEPSEYWDPSSGYYVLYIDVKNACYAENGVETGYTEAVDKFYSIKLNVNGTTKAGKLCEDNADCGPDGVCTLCSQLGDSCSWFQKVTGKKKCSGGGTTGGNSLIGAKKLSLTKEEITKSTTPQLLASACKFDSECLDREDIKGDSFSTSCNSLANLRQEGTLSQSDEDEFMTSGKSMVTTGIIGGALGGTIGLVLCALGIGAAEVATGGTATPILIPATATCASLVGSGALLGAGVTVGGTLAWDQLRSDDELVEAFKSNDASSVGICTAEKGFDLSGIIEKLAFFNITGNPLWDGLIILGGILVILYIFVGGRKG